MPTTSAPLVAYVFNTDTDMFTNGLTGSITGNFAMPAVYAQGVANTAIYFDGIQQYLDLGDLRSQCFGSLDLCPSGASYAFWIWIGSTKAMTPERQYILSSGAQTPSTPGITVYMEGGVLYAVTSTTAATWGPVSIPVSPKTWYQVAFSWSQANGLWLYINGVQIGKVETSTVFSQVNTPSSNNFVIGKPNDADTNFGEFYMDTMNFWSEYREEQFFADFYANFSFSKCKNRLYYKHLLVILTPAWEHLQRIQKFNFRDMHRVTIFFLNLIVILF